MGRMVRMIAVLAVVLGAFVVGLSASAEAATPGGFVAATANCTGPSGYPVQAGATISVSTTTPYHGQTIEVSGSNYQAGDTITISLGGSQVAQTQADSSGNFRVSVKITALPGTVQLRAVGSVCGSASLSLLVRSASGVEPTSAQNTPPGSAAGTSGSGLAFTGLDVAGLIAIAIGLLLGGLYLTRAGRRRRAHG